MQGKGRFEVLGGCESGSRAKHPHSLKKRSRGLGKFYCKFSYKLQTQVTSVMFSGMAAGELLPPRVVYKVANVYVSWKEGGPAETLYSCTASGSYNSFQFQNYFFQLVLPYLRRREDKTLLKGDNLASHLSSPAVIESYRSNNIASKFYG